MKELYAILFSILFHLSLSSFPSVQCLKIHWKLRLLIGIVLSIGTLFFKHQLYSHTQPPTPLPPFHHPTLITYSESAPSFTSNKTPQTQDSTPSSMLASHNLTKTNTSPTSSSSESATSSLTHGNLSTASFNTQKPTQLHISLTPLSHSTSCLM